jgi:cytochrome oxidase Cu insertion factor (SCO1/SenC/PrrC family)
LFLRTLREELGLGASMKIAGCILFLVAISAVHGAQDGASIRRAVAQPVGLEVGQQAPPFALPDQFGHQQSNQTLKGSRGTVILFFRSADW